MKARKDRRKRQRAYAKQAGVRLGFFGPNKKPRVR